jgi:hypothetical protein
MAFCVYYRQEIRKLEPKLSSVEITKLIGTKWNSLTDEEKKQWKEEADRLNLQDF